jgi:hypothetical protein
VHLGEGELPARVGDTGLLVRPSPCRWPGFVL